MTEYVYIVVAYMCQSEYLIQAVIIYLMQASTATGDQTYPRPPKHTKCSKQKSLT